MAKKFTILTVIGENLEEDLYYPGFVEPDKLKNSKKFVEILSDVSELVKVNVKLEHCLLLDVKGENEDISLEGLGILLDRFDYFLDNDHILLEEEITFEITGLKEEEFEENT